jgi:hypothetical protein
MAWWIKGRFPLGSTCLDVGACDGNWYNLLGDYLVMDAVEIYQPSIDYHHLDEKYRKVYCTDIADFTYDWYDLIIFGDVIEHMTVEKAQKALEYAKPRCHNMLIAVPFLFRQGPIYGNQWEAHLQEDLTPELFDRRYPGFDIVNRPLPNYAYYIKKE